MRFMVESHLAGPPTPEVFALFASETARGKQLDADGLRRHLFLAADRSGSWQVFDVDSRDEVDRLLASFPLHPYVTETITELEPRTGGET